MPDSSPSTHQNPDEQRRQPRHVESGAITLSIDLQELVGEVSNLSAGGIMFLSAGDLSITVEYEEQGQVRRRRGRLVRVQRMSSKDTAYAIEFEAE